MTDKLSSKMVLRHVEVLEQELARLKRDLLHGLVVQTQPRGLKPSLFGSIRGGDMTEEMIEDAKRGLFRDLEDI